MISLHILLQYFRLGNERCSEQFLPLYVVLDLLICVLAGSLTLELVGMCFSIVGTLLNEVAEIFLNDKFVFRIKPKKKEKVS